MPATTLVGNMRTSQHRRPVDRDGVSRELQDIAGQVTRVLPLVNGSGMLPSTWASRVDNVTLDAGSCSLEETDPWIPGLPMA
jgi:hypothetical protein